MRNLHRLTLSFTALTCAAALATVLIFHLMPLRTYLRCKPPALCDDGMSIHLSGRLPVGAPSIRSAHLAQFSYQHWPEPCSQRSFQPLLLGAIISTPGSLTRRQILRRLHMSVIEHAGFHLRWIFILGIVQKATLQSLIDDEAGRFGDIVQLSFHDSYENLTLKSLAAMDWATSACPGAKFFLKADEDTMVNPYRAVEFLLSMKPSEAHYLYAGYVPSLLKPNRDSGKKKWRVSYENYPLVKFPPYAIGAGYLLSCGALFRVFAASDSTYPMRLEDTYVGMCALRAGLAPRHLPLVFGNDLVDHADWCRYRKGIIGLDMAESDMIGIWQNITEIGGLKFAGCAGAEQ